MIRRRRGMSLLEIAVTGALLATLLAISVQFLGATAAGRQALRRNDTAIREAANVMERLSTRPWREITPQGVEDCQLSEEALGVLAGAKLEIDVTPTDREPEGKQITVVIRWQEAADLPDRSVRLTAWRYRQADSE